MEIQRIYFIGIGGIGMSALARYFLHEGREVAGYDRTRSALTEALEPPFTTRTTRRPFPPRSASGRAPWWSTPPPCRTTTPN